MDSVKVDSIMEMMKTDPAFEHLFSTFGKSNAMPVVLRDRAQKVSKSFYETVLRQNSYFVK